MSVIFAVWQFPKTLITLVRFVYKSNNTKVYNFIYWKSYKTQCLILKTC